ncbi:MAG: hypothetical protein NTY76_01730 [Candidatus Omnitrophica bacterium]|nr:hypothetical protein [Candidatus Omnitrophota bacterium]
MKIKKTVIVFFISIVVAAAVLGLTGRAIHAQSSDSSDSVVAAKLDKVLVNQKSIMEDLAAMKEELRIIKVRITQAQ